MPRISQKKLRELTATYERLGVDDPAGYAHLQLTEDPAALAKFVFLREAWRDCVVDEDRTEWIDNAIAGTRRDPNGPCAAGDAVLERLLGGAALHRRRVDLRGLASVDGSRDRAGVRRGEHRVPHEDLG